MHRMQLGTESVEIAPPACAAPALAFIADGEIENVIV